MEHPWSQHTFDADRAAPSDDSIAGWRGRRRNLRIEFSVVDNLGFSQIFSEGDIVVKAMNVHISYDDMTPQEL